MFDGLTVRFDRILRQIRGRGRLGPEEIDEILGEIRVALLEADVNLEVVRTFQRRIRERALGAELGGVLNPGQQVVRIVLDEMTAVLGGETVRLAYASRPPTVVLLAGLQGSGKTTAAAKLARWFKAQGRNPLLIGADLQRPAAVEQLRTLGDRIGVPVFSEATDPTAVAREGRAEAVRLGRDIVICDTAGRLAIDDDLMDEVVDMLLLYEVKELPSGLSEQVDLIRRCAEVTADAMPRLRTMKELSEYWIEINRLENAGDKNHRRLRAHLFSGEYKAMEVLKLKDIAETLEAAIDAFEKVANTVEQIAVKES